MDSQNKNPLSGKNAKSGRLNRIFVILCVLVIFAQFGRNYEFLEGTWTTCKEPLMGVTIKDVFQEKDLVGNSNIVFDYFSSPKAFYTVGIVAKKSFGNIFILKISPGAISLGFTQDVIARLPITRDLILIAHPLQEKLFLEGRWFCHEKK